MVFATEAAHIQKMLLGSREESIEAERKLAQYNHARKEHTTALAAAEKLLDPKTGDKKWLETQEQFDEENEHDEREDR